MIYLDFKRAFDSVPHQRLLKKLFNYGIRGNVHAWIADFLSGRTQLVVVNGVSSLPVQIGSGVPQGSVLGPVLFTLYINDMPKYVQSLLYLYADDTKILRQVRSTEDETILQEDLLRLSEWSKIWLLEFHPSKCKVIEISKKSSKRNFNYSLDGYPLQHTTSERDLGIIVSEDLKFSDCVADRICKANRIVGLIRRTFQYLDCNTFVLLFKSLVRPHLEYLAPVWSPYLAGDEVALEAVQRRATKLIANLKHLTYEQRLERLNLPSLKTRRERGDLIEAYKIINQIYDPKVTNNLITLQRNREDHNQNMRSHENGVIVHRSRLDIRKNFFTNRVARSWNALPNSVKTSLSVRSFEGSLDRYWKSTGHPI
jgi:hypothetical protein